MNTIYVCNCIGRGHDSGCLLLKRLRIKYALIREWGGVSEELEQEVDRRMELSR